MRHKDNDILNFDLVIEQLRDERDRCDSAIQVLEGIGNHARTTGRRAARANRTNMRRTTTGRRHVSAAGRRRIAAAQRARWANVRMMKGSKRKAA